MKTVSEKPPKKITQKIFQFEKSQMGGTSILK